MRLMGTTIAAAVTLTMSAGAALAQEHTTFDIERSAEQTAAYEDFTRSFDQRDTFGMWDTDGDEMLSREEVRVGVLKIYDVNDDDALDTDELATMGNDSLFRDDVEQNDAGLDLTQWETWDVWDTDDNDMLTRDEFNEGVFGLFDANQDNMLDDNEITTMRGERLFADETVNAGNAPTEAQD